jgi:hypothetical protein
LELVVIRGIGEGESKHALFFQVRFVNAREGTDNDSEASQEPWLERSVLTGRAFTVVMVTDDNPLNSLLPVGGGSLRHTTPFACDLVLDLVCLAVLTVDSTNEAVLCTIVKKGGEDRENKNLTRDVFKMTAILKPGTTS